MMGKRHKNFCSLSEKSNFTVATNTLEVVFLVFQEPILLVVDFLVGSSLNLSRNVP